jgi:hypothetical protein
MEYLASTTEMQRLESRTLIHWVRESAKLSYSIWIGVCKVHYRKRYNVYDIYRLEEARLIQCD